MSKSRRKAMLLFRVQRTANTTMALSQNPIMGQMTGSYANVNTFTRNGRNVVSAKVFNPKNANTPAQQLHRASFKLVVDAFTELGGYAEKSFPQRAVKLSPYNVFMALNLPNAIDSSGDVPTLDYSKLQVAKGTLPKVTVEQASINADGIVLNCESGIDYGKASADDVVIVLVKRYGKPVKAFRNMRGAEEQLQIEIALPGIVADDIEFVYLYALNQKGDKAMNSCFVQLT